MELKDLVGLHKLSGVDISTENDAAVIKFVLDKITYKATEDPEDGYRSSCRELQVTEEKVSNKFPSQKVMVKTDGIAYNDIIQLIDIKTGKVVLEVGTDNSDGYYPCCVMYFEPRHMAINIGK